MTRLGGDDDFGVIFSVGGPTAVKLNTFDLRRSSQGILLQWTSGAEIGTAGYHVWSGTGAGEFERITTTLIPTSGRAVASAKYRFEDKSPL